MLKVLTNTKDFQHLTIKPILKVQYINNPNIIIKNQPCFSQVFEMRITFDSCCRYMTYYYYLKQPKPMCEIKLNQFVHKSQQFINNLNRVTIYPFIQENAYT